VTCRLNEIDTSMNTVVHQLETVHSVLLLEVGVETSFNVVDNGSPAGTFQLLTPYADV
jgi:hypothetical protein